jgi:acetyl-CoA/propionyl-CoA carboxylase, biotin carboxylase, biotin carboxyl carrier protein
MKMEHALTAPIAGVLTELSASAGQSVVMDQVLAVVTPTEEGQ